MCKVRQEFTAARKRWNRRPGNGKLLALWRLVEDWLSGGGGGGYVYVYPPFVLIALASRLLQVHKLQVNHDQQRQALTVKQLVMMLPVLTL